ncbi:nuclear pore complex protein Nup98-96 [Oratosquilla oratoria]|uniref:nuclear pore complex protein Nup98-96 n=1 Tax=Oratosquilla oratoria TaxID=337810 RepID=UPI003F770096
MFSARPPQFGAGGSFGFGSTQTPTTGFGGTFGRSTFGQGTTGFSSSTPFGTGGTSTGTSLFGTTTQPQNTTGGLFSQQQQQPQTAGGFGQTPGGFGATSGSGLFGQQNQQQTGTGLFGTGTSFSQQNQSRPFGFGTTTTTTTSGGSLFGTQPTTGGLFGATSTGFGSGTAVTGTTIKYNAVTGTDTVSRNGQSNSIQTRMECITCMKEYESKSLEELRVEDYLSGRKGPGAGAALGGFGQPPPSQPGGLFGQSTTGLFGQTKPAENKPLFGASTSTTTTGFGATNTSGGLFGATPFGQPATSTASSFSFGQNQPNKSGFGFGTNPTTSAPSLFGQNPQPTATGFGSTGTGFGFGQNTQQTGLFGQPNKSFGAATTSTPSLFGSNTSTQSGGLFGAKPAGQTGFGSFGFSSGSTAATPFGTTTSSTPGLFGSQSSQAKTGFPPTGASTGFGNTTPSFGSSLFGHNTATQQKPATLGFGVGPGFNSPGGTGVLPFGSGTSAGTGFTIGGGTGGSGLFGTTNPALGAQPALVNPVNTGTGNNANIVNLIKALTHDPFSDSPLLKNASAPKGKADELLQKTQDTQKPTTTVKPTYVSSSPANKIKPTPISKNNTGNRQWFFSGLDDPKENSDDIFKPNSYRSVKRLNLKVFKNSRPDSSTNGVIQAIADSASDIASSPVTPLTVPLNEVSPSKPPSISASHDNTPTPDIIKGRHNIKGLKLNDKETMDDTLADLNVRRVQQNGTATNNNNEQEEQEEEQENHVPELENETNKENISIFDISSTDEIQEEDNPAVQFNASGVKLTRRGYYTIPPLDKLGEMTDSNGQCWVDNFAIGRKGYGNVCFPGPTDVAGLDLDSLVYILRKQIEIYPEGVEKPAQGQGLNKAAIVTLDCVWPVDKTTRHVVKQEERLEAMGWTDHLERQCIKMDSSFVEYRPDTGSWVFKVKHFSKYGLGEDEEDASVMQPPPASTRPPVPPVAAKVSVHSTQLPAATTIRITGPPATALVSPPPHMPLPPLVASPAFTSVTPKQVFLDGTSMMAEDMLDIDIAIEPEESAALSVLSPSSERMAVSKAIVPRKVQLIKSQFFMETDADQQSDLESPPIPKVSAKRLMLSSDFSISQTGIPGDSSFSHIHSPAPLDKSMAKPLVILQPESALSPESPEKKSTGLESSFLSTLREPRSDYKILRGQDLSSEECGQAPPKHSTEILPLESSLIAGKENLFIDASAFMGRSFRVGWGPGWTLVHAGMALDSKISLEVNLKEDEEEEEMEAAPEVPAEKPAASFVFSELSLSAPAPATSKDKARYSLCMEHIHLVDPKMKTLDKLIKISLEHVLELSTKIQDTCPMYRPNKDVELVHSLADAAKMHNSEESVIWHLCVALWGHMDFYSPEADGESDYALCRARVEAVSQWLEEVSSSTVLLEVINAKSRESQEPESYLEAVFSYLTAREIAPACMLAQSKGDHNLALLLSQAYGGQEAARMLLEGQLANWAEGGTDAFMSRSRLAIYALLAGLPTHQASNGLVNTCTGLDWKRAFALHLWYKCPATCTVKEALTEYEKACGLVDSEIEYCEKPLPSYLSGLLPPEETNVSYDVCYHLLKLFTDPTHRLEVLLNPATASPDPLNICTSWLLWRVLESLGYHHLSDVQSSSLHLAMAAYLETAGVWHWAVFVLLNINDVDKRTSEIKEVLNRCVLVGDEDQEEQISREEFVTERLGVPKQWIDQAKAIKARTLKLTDDEAWYLLEASDYNEAHRIIVNTIAPSAIINEDHEYLSRYLEKFADESVQNQVADWQTGGSVYADYLSVCQVVCNMKKSGAPTPASLEQLRPKLLALCSRLNNLRCTNATQRLCLSEMSRVVVGVLRAVVGDGFDATQVLAQQVTVLPLTQDYALTEINHITQQYLTHLVGEAQVPG